MGRSSRNPGSLCISWLPQNGVFTPGAMGDQVLLDSWGLPQGWEPGPIKSLFCLVLQEEEALLNEMESTGQAFEEMQEQNVRLVQQLKEKDDANFKLMSEVSRS